MYGFYEGEMVKYENEFFNIIGLIGQRSIEKNIMLINITQQMHYDVNIVPIKT